MTSFPEQVLVSGSNAKSPPQEIPGSTGVALKPLPQFMKLPTELRLKIYSLTYPGPRKVVLNAGFSFRPTNEVDLEPGVNRYTTPLPVALHLNSESRHEALKIYGESIVTMRDFKSVGLKSFGPLWFNHTIDTFQIQCQESFDILESNSLRVIASICPITTPQIKKVELIANWAQARCLMSSIHISIPSLGNIGPLGALFYLGGIEEVILTIHESKEEHGKTYSSDSLFRWRQRRLQDHLELHKDGFASGCAPVVKIGRVLI